MTAFADLRRLQLIPMSTAVLRVLHVLRAAGITDAGRPERVPSANEVWYADPYVVRLTTSPASRRLAHEVSVARMLPPGVPYPPIVHHGADDLCEWLITVRVPGQALSRAWTGMSEQERCEAVTQLGGVMRRLHRVHERRAPDRAIRPPFLEGDTLECPHQLPGKRILELVDRARLLPHVDPTVLDAAADLVGAYADALDEEATALVHGDLHFENVMWDGESITALLDLEWARLGSADIDLDVLLRFCAAPFLHVAGDYAHLARRQDYREVPRWLRHAYPALFGHPRLRERLTLYNLSYDLRGLLLDPPAGRPEGLEPYHPYNRVRRLVSGDTHLEWMAL